MILAREVCAPYYVMATGFSEFVFRFDFKAEDGSLEVYEARPLIEEDKAEADAMWETMTGGNYSAKKKKRLGKNE